MTGRVGPGVPPGEGRGGPTPENEAQCAAEIADYLEIMPAMTEGERAEEEERLVSTWWKRVHLDPHPPQQDRWLRAKLGLPAAALRWRIRRTLVNHGGSHLGRALWLRLDADMPYRTALDMAGHAGELVKSQKMPLDGVIAELLEEYDRRPILKFFGGGKIVRTGVPVSPAEKAASDKVLAGLGVREVLHASGHPRVGASPPLQTTTLRRRVPPSGTVAPPPSSGRPATPVSSGDPPSLGNTPGTPSTPDEHAILLSLRTLLMAYANEVGAILPVEERERMVDEHHVELNGILRGFRQRVKRQVARAAGEELMITRSAVREACQRLSVPLPKMGEPVNLKLVRKLYRQQAWQHHPDKTDDAVRHEVFRALTHANDVLSQYNDSLTPRAERGETTQSAPVRGEREKGS